LLTLTTTKLFELCTRSVHQLTHSGMGRHAHTSPATYIASLQCIILLVHLILSITTHTNNTNNNYKNKALVLFV